MRVVAYTDAGVEVHLDILEIGPDGNGWIELVRNGSVESDVRIYKQELLKLEVFP